MTDTRKNLERGFDGLGHPQKLELKLCNGILAAKERKERIDQIGYSIVSSFAFSAFFCGYI